MTSNEQRISMLIDHDDIPQVSQDFMNNTHSEEVTLINALFEEILAYENDQKDSNTVDTMYQAWIEHTVEHFTTEEVEMIEAQFPAFPMHKQAHDDALKQMNEVFDTWKKSKEVKILKMYFIEVIPQWFVAHVSTMDAMTANYIGGGMASAGAGMSRF
jgi:hemerythrin